MLYIVNSDRWIYQNGKNMLNGIEVRLDTNYLSDRLKYNSLAKKIVYTGAIDEYFDYQFGNLEYRSVRFENEILDIPNFRVEMQQ